MQGLSPRGEAAENPELGGKFGRKLRRKSGSSRRRAGNTLWRAGPLRYPGSLTYSWVPLHCVCTAERRILWRPISRRHSWSWTRTAGCTKCHEASSHAGTRFVEFLPLARAAVLRFALQRVALYYGFYCNPSRNSTNRVQTILEREGRAGSTKNPPHPDIMHKAPPSHWFSCFRARRVKEPRAPAERPDRWRMLGMPRDLRHFNRRQ